MKRRHNMPFGAEFLGDGSVRFRLWAPAAGQIELGLIDAKTIDAKTIDAKTIEARPSAWLSLEARDQGWFELVTNAAKSGAQYRFRVDGAKEIPDPASRFQPRDVHGPSEVVDPDAFDWQDTVWRGRRWEEAVIYELHVGAFTPSGTFSSALDRLDYLADLGITAIELMPV